MEILFKSEFRYPHLYDLLHLATHLVAGINYFAFGSDNTSYKQVCFKHTKP